MKLALLGRDGVINHTRNGGVNHRTQLEEIDGSINAIAQLSSMGYTIIVITHQPGISRGLLDLDELEAIHSEISTRVESAGGVIEAIFYCPHDEQERCHCRPPDTGLLDVIEMEFDCNTSDALFFYCSAEEKILSQAKHCRGFECSAATTLAQRVQQLITEETQC